LSAAADGASADSSEGVASDGGTLLDGGAPSTDAAAPDVNPSALTYLEDIHPLFEATGCMTSQCHGSTAASAGTLVLLSDPVTGYRDMIDRVSVRRPEVIVRAFAPDESVLVEHAETTLRSMGILHPSHVERVRRWVAEGAVFSRVVTLEAASASAPPNATSADAGTTDGGAPTGCSIEGLRGFPSLPAACMPRCSSETWNAVVACRSAPDPSACQQDVIRADSTAATMVGGTFEPQSINCDTCLTWQTRSCVDQFCRFELLALDRCLIFREGATCAAQTAAMNACVARAPGFAACQRARDAQCAGR
jgi:hypothetical protein